MYTARKYVHTRVLYVSPLGVATVAAAAAATASLTHSCLPILLNRSFTCSRFSLASVCVARSFVCLYVIDGVSAVSVVVVVRSIERMFCVK